MNDVFIGRQPIYEKNLKLFAYELLFRSEEKINYASFPDEDLATTKVIVNSIIEIGLDQISGNLPVFFNMTRNYLLSDNPLPFSEKRIVLEILENIAIDERIFSSIKKLSDRGYSIALDDFVFHESKKQLLDIVDIVKIDISNFKRKDLEQQVNYIKQHQVKLLAERVETQDDYDFCKSLDFDFYQGFFFSKPRIIKGQSFPSHKQAILRVLMKLNETNVSVAELEEEISNDVSLSYRLLRVVNSAFFALPRKIDSIRQAVTYLGLNTTRNLATLLTLSCIEEKPRELIKTAMIRAKFCKKLSAIYGMPHREIYYTVGLFSTLDALMDAPMETILQGLPLSADITDALLYGEGLPGEILKKVLAYERGDWDKVSFRGVRVNEITSAYLDSVRWTESSINEVF